MDVRAQPITYVPLTPAMRSRLETTIEQLIGLLDEIDGDPDFEPDNEDQPDFEPGPERRRVSLPVT